MKTILESRFVAGARISGRVALLLGAFGLLLPSARPAEETAASAANKIFREHQEAVIWVSAVAKLSFSAEGAKDTPINIPDREQKAEALGTIIDGDGMVVTALSAIDPARDYVGREMRTRDGMIKIDASSVLKEVKIILPDGTELPSELLMRDVDLDLAFLKPKSGSKELKGVVFNSVDLKSSGAVNVTEDAITLSRADEVLNRAPSVVRGQITTITKKPREFLRATGVSLGCPTFSADGRLIGIGVNRSLRGKSSANVLIPATDVLEIAEQARTSRPPAGRKEISAP